MTKGHVLLPARLGQLFNSIRRLRGELVWVMVGQFLAFAGGLAAIKLLTNIMGPAHYGELAIGLTVSGLVSLFFFGPLGQGVMRFFSICRENATLPAYFSAVRKLHIRISVLLAVIAFPVVLVTAFATDSRWVLVVLLGLLFGYLSGINNSFLSLQNALRQRKIVAIHQGADIWLRLGLAVLLLISVSHAGIFALAAYCMGMVVIIISQRIFAFRDACVVDNWLKSRNIPVSKQGVSEQDVYRSILLYIKPFLYFAVLGVFVLYADRWILLGLHGEEVVGIYAALYMIASAPLTLLINLTGQFVLPVVFDQSGAMQRREQALQSGRSVMLSVLIMGGAMVFFVLIAFLFGERIIYWMSNEQFSEYASSFWVIVMGLCLFHLGQLLVMRGLTFGRPDIYILPKAVQAVSFFVLAWWLAREMSIMGVAVALCISSLLYLGAVMRANRQLVLPDLKQQR